MVNGLRAHLAMQREQARRLASVSRQLQKSMTVVDTRQSSQLEYEQLEAALVQAGAAVSAGEAHGILCGLCSVRPVVNTGDWEPLILGDVPPGDAALADARRLLEQLWRQGMQQLESADCAFKLMLPPDTRRLSQRTELLGGWCAGFLYALGLAGEDSYGRLSSEAREFVRDLTEISRIDAGVEGDEQEEAAYTEVLEYVRVGVLMVYEDLRQSRQPPGADRLH